MAALGSIVQSLIGIWLGLWIIGGIAMGTCGLLILALQLYGWFGLGYWFPLTPARLLQGFEIGNPVITWWPLQSIVDCALNLPLSLLFVFCGFSIAAMAWIARKNWKSRRIVPSGANALPIGLCPPRMHRDGPNPFGNMFGGRRLLSFHHNRLPQG
jgi:hypothetical protein